MRKHDLISQYRLPLMGFATLWVAFLHAQMWFKFPPLAVFKHTGHGGVDLFLFLSSFGLYYAYHKGVTGFAFYKRRLLRILPAFFIIAIIRIFYFHYGKRRGLLLLSTLIYWTHDDRSMWYISACVLFYAIATIYLKYFKDGKEEKLTWIMVLASLCFSFFFFDNMKLLLFSRLPIFFLGFLAGKYSYEGREITKKQWILFGISFVVGVILQLLAFGLDQEGEILWGKGMYWYPPLLISWPLCLYLSIFFDWIRTSFWKWIPVGLSKLGEVSLEFYLLHEICIDYFTKLFNMPPRINYDGIPVNMIVLVLTFVIAKVLHGIIRMGMQLIVKD